MKTLFAVIGTIALLLLCRLFFAATGPAMFGGGTTPNMHPEYRDVDGDGFVPAQGDPLYDAHYAENVNVPNSQAQESLAGAEYSQAQAELALAQAEQTRMLTRTVVLIFGAVVAFFVLAKLMKGG